MSPRVTFDDILQDPSRAKTLTIEDHVAMGRDILQVQTALNEALPGAIQKPDEWLTLKEAAALRKISPKHLYRYKESFPGYDRPGGIGPIRFLKSAFMGKPQKPLPPETQRGIVSG